MLFKAVSLSPHSPTNKSTYFFGCLFFQIYIVVFLIFPNIYSFDPCQFIGVHKFFITVISYLHCRHRKGDAIVTPLMEYVRQRRGVKNGPLVCLSFRRSCFKSMVFLSHFVLDTYLLTIDSFIFLETKCKLHKYRYNM